MSITLKQMRYAVAVAETGHFGRAAEQCHVSQPALSQQIQLIEEDCGTPLFYDNTEGNRVNFTIGSLDHPELFPPHANTGNESRVPWFDTLTTIEHGGNTETGQEEWASAIKSTNHQHPDRDTERWPE